MMYQKAYRYTKNWGGISYRLSNQSKNEKLLPNCTREGRSITRSEKSLFPGYSVLRFLRSNDNTRGYTYSAVSVYKPMVYLYRALYELVTQFTMHFRLGHIYLLVAFLAGTAVASPFNGCFCSLRNISQAN